MYKDTSVAALLLFLCCITFNTENWKQPKCPTIEDWLNKLRYGQMKSTLIPWDLSKLRYWVERIKKQKDTLDWSISLAFLLAHPQIFWFIGTVSLPARLVTSGLSSSLCKMAVDSSPALQLRDPTASLQRETCACLGTLFDKDFPCCHISSSLSLYEDSD